MKRTESTQPRAPGPNLTPLVDVMLVILIFMMLSASFTAYTHFLAVTAPPRGGLPDEGGSGLPDDVLSVRVDAPGGGFVARVAGQTARDPGQLADLLRTRAEALESEGLAAGHVRVVIQPAGNVSFAKLVEAQQAVLGAHFTQVSFAPAH